MLYVIALLGAVSYFRVTLFDATIAIFSLLVLTSITDLVGEFTWLVCLIAALPLNIESVRKQHIIKPFMKTYKKIMPEMSGTEKDAIDAGTVWWDGEIFSGNPNWQTLHNITQVRPTAQERAFLYGPLRKVYNICDDWEVTHKNAGLSAKVWQYLKDNKFFDMIIKKEFGGLDFSAYWPSWGLQQPSSVSSVLLTTIGVPNSSGPGELLQYCGTQKQKTIICQG